MRGRKKSEETRQAILRGASELFAEKPFHEVLTDDLSARLGVGKGTIYRYFRSKEELYFAAIMDGLGDMHDAVSSVFATDTPLEETVETLARTLITYFWERRDFFVLLHRHEPHLDPGERAEWHRRREEYVEMVAESVARELERRGAHGVDARMAVEMLFGMIRSVCLYRRPGDRIDALVELVTGTFLHGVLPAPTVNGRRRPAARLVARRRAPV